MQQQLDAKIILVVRPTRLDELVTRFNTAAQAQFYVEHLGADFSDYLIEHKRYGEAVAAAETSLRAHGRVQRLERRYLANFVFGPADLVVVLGQDGLVANTLKYLDGQSVIGVNPEPGRWDGVLLPFRVEDLARIVPEQQAGRRRIKSVTMAKAELSNGAVLHAVNDLFIGPKSHGSARYIITVGKSSEAQSSSGVIVSTGLGSTGWLKSVFAGWTGIAASLGGAPQPIEGSFPCDADFLNFYVREPFPSQVTGSSIVLGRIAGRERLELVSQMPEHGVVFSDGMEADFLDFGSGIRASIGIAERRGMLVT